MIRYKLEIFQTDDYCLDEAYTDWTWYINHRSYCNKDQDKSITSLESDYDVYEGSLKGDLQALRDKGIHAFGIMCYEHSGIRLWLGEEKTDSFDSGVFAIAIYTGSEPYDESSSRALLEQEIQEWNLRNSGDVYGYNVVKEESKVYVNENDPEDKIEEWFEVDSDSCSGFICDDLKSFRESVDGYSDLFKHITDEQWEQAWENRYA